MTESKPRERDVRLRIRVRAEHSDNAAAAFKKAGFAPIYVGQRSDGAVSFWFGKDVDADHHRVAIAIPRDWYAIQGIVH